MTKELRAFKGEAFHCVEELAKLKSFNKWSRYAENRMTQLQKKNTHSEEDKNKWRKKADKWLKDGEF